MAAQIPLCLVRLAVRYLQDEQHSLGMHVPAAHDLSIRHWPAFGYLAIQGPVHTCHIEVIEVHLELISQHLLTILEMRPTSSMVG